MKSIFSSKGFYLVHLFLISTAFAYSPFTNFVAPIRVNSMVMSDDYIWAATKGGLLRIQDPDYKLKLYSNVDNLPDLHLNTVCLDSSQNLWIGSDKGYLTKMTPKGRFKTFTSYFASDWDISHLLAIKHYLIIGSSKGCSVFDTKKELSIQNALLFNGLKPPITAITVFKDTLFLGFKEGIAKLYIAGEALVQANFIDESIWTVSKTTEEIKSFLTINDSLLFSEKITAYYNNAIINSLDSVLFQDTVLVDTFTSFITTLVTDQENNCWIGTEDDFLYKWDGSTFTQYSIPGLTFNIVNRVYVGKDSRVWCIPRIPHAEGEKELSWNYGICMYDGEQWSLYTSHNTKNLGYIGGRDFLGIAEDRFGNMWFGTNGRHVKKYDAQENFWWKYFIGSQASATFERLKIGESKGWGKCDAIAQDSSGYLWFGVYNGQGGTVGSIFCYNPEHEKPDDSSFEYFFPYTSLYYLQVPRALNVDAAGRIFVGGTEDDFGKLVVFDYDGNPLENGINTPLYTENLTNVRDMASMSGPADSGTWIVSFQGLHYFQYHHTEGAQLINIDNAPENISCVETERTNRYAYTDNNGNQLGDSARVETVLWLGTQQQGLRKVYAYTKMGQNGVVHSGGVDSIQTYTENQGLVDNNITHLDIDRKKGFLWLATENGLSRFYLGHSLKKIESNINLVAYPNPFIQTRHREIIIENVVPGSSISVYTVDGRLIAYLTDIGKNVRKTLNSWTYIWEPGRDLLPGTYFYTAKVDNNLGNRKHRGNIGKILILP